MQLARRLFLYVCIYPLPSPYEALGDKKVNDFALQIELGHIKLFFLKQIKLSKTHIPDRGANMLPSRLPI